MSSNTLDPLVDFIHRLDFEELPSALVEQAKRHLLDTLGAALAGTTSEIARKTFRQLALSEPRGSARVWGTDTCFSPRVAAHALELDDTGGCDHSGAVVVPALLAVLPLIEREVSGRELLTAMVAGYEVGRRVLEACGGYSSHNQDGWHSTGTCGVFAAAAACAKLLALDPHALRSAVTLSGSFSAGLWAFIHDGSQSKKLHAGRAAESGVHAALLAQAGIEGPSHLFDDVWGGFLTTLAPTHADPAALTTGLGERWRLSRCSIKPYASCRGTHAAIDALAQLMAQASVDAQGIERVEVRLSPFLDQMCGTRDLANLANAQMSLPYALAAQAEFGDAGLDAYAAEQRRSPRLLALMERIRLEVDERCDKDREPDVTLVTSDGRRLSTRVDIALGNPLNPLDDAQLLAKFDGLARRALPAEQVARIAHACLALKRLDTIEPLMQALAGES